MKHKTKVVSISLFLSALIIFISCGKQKVDWNGKIEMIDGVKVVHNFEPDPEVSFKAVEFIVDLSRQFPEKPVYVTFSAQKKHMDAARDYLEPKGVPTFPLIEEPFEVLDILYRCREALERGL